MPSCREWTALLSAIDEQLLFYIVSRWPQWVVINKLGQFDERSFAQEVQGTSHGIC
jgi:hypothetical protein